jgi:hypothetical protein
MAGKESGLFSPRKIPSPASIWIIAAHRTAPLQPWALDIVQHLDSYTEWSPSGEGLHVLIRASLPGSGGRRHHGIEVYSSARYFTITGGHYEQAPQTIEWRQQEALDLLAKLATGDRAHRCVRLSSRRIPATDEELLGRAGHAANGWKVKKLWAGDSSDYDCDHEPRGRRALFVARLLHGWRPRARRPIVPLVWFVPAEMGSTHCRLDLWRNHHRGIDEKRISS